ncbi:hypothetical protein [Amycolatopsis kentuckyensis]|uniref:hypothetical protein n=1 Tax=Amycolatopsis kentuckyensis TaxID=218823 RepID=UPI000A380B1B|nr:hypothetical protein [Amycolatopsis kentuckyensis]
MTTTPQTTAADVPAPPIGPHVTVLLAAGAAVFGLAALVLLLFVITMKISGAPMAFAGLVATALGVAAAVVHCARRVTQYQRDCYVANREASRAEVKTALKKVHQEVDSLKARWERAELARVSAAVVAQERPHRLDVINGGGNGLG